MLFRSPLKAYYVERNRLFVAAKNFPASRLALVPWIALARYFWHVVALAGGRGAAGRYWQEGHGGWPLAWRVLRAHFALLRHAGSLWKKRRRIRRSARRHR